MLIKDLNFLEPIEQINEIQGGKSSKAKSTKKPGVSAKALAVGDKTYTKVSTKKVKAPPKSKALSDLKKKALSDFKEIDILSFGELHLYF